MISRFALKLAIPLATLATAAGTMLPASATTVSATTVSATTAPATTASARHAESGTITGIVLNRRGAPLASLCVTAQSVTSEASTGRVAITSATGRFTVAGLPAGGYDLSYHRCTTHGLISWPGNAADQAMTVLGMHGPARVYVAAGHLTALSPVRVAAGQPSPAANRMPTPPRQRFVKLTAHSRERTSRRFGGISGLVTGPHGKHIAGLCVDLITPAFTQGMEVGPRGGFHTGKILFPGKYLVEFTPNCGFDVDTKSAGNWAPQWYRDKFRQSEAIPVRIRAGQITKGIDAVMRPGAVVSGTVTDPSGGAAPKVCVVLTTPKGDFVAQVKTSANGGYRVEGLDPGRYQAGFFPSCGGPSQFLDQWWPQKLTETSAKTVKVRFGTHRRHVDDRLVRGGTIRGTIRFKTAHGRLLRGVCVDAEPAGQTFGRDFSTASGPKGVYSLRGLPAGRYSISFDHGCGNDANFLFRNFPHPVTARVSKVTGHINIVLKAGAIARGKVTDKVTGKPLSRICVFIDDADAVTETRADGSFSVEQIPPGRSEVDFENCGNHGSFAPQSYHGQLNPVAANRVVFRGGRVTGHLDAAMTPGGTISGTVTAASGKPLSNVCAEAIPVGDVAIDGSDAIGDDGFFGTSVKGSYSISNLPAGQFQVAFSTCDVEPNVADQWYPDQAQPGKAARINVSPGSRISHIDAVLQKAGSISGQIIGASANPIVCITVTSESAGLEESGQLFFGTGYQIDGLLPGRYTVEFEPCGGQNLATQWYDRAGFSARARAVAVRAGQITGSVDAHLVKGGSITGRVVSKETGKPLPGVCVSAEDTSANFFGFGGTNSSGHYRVTGLNTGTYRLTFASCSDLELRPVVSARLHAVTGRTVAGPDVAMSAQREGAITGTVRSGAPHPTRTAGVCVDAIPVAGQDDGAFEGVATTDRGGFYHLSGLVPGRYKVFLGDPACYTDPGGLVPQWFDARSSPKTATVITIHPGQTMRSVSAVLKPDGWISGTVSGPASPARALAGTCVVATPVTGHQAPMLAISAASGHYRLGPLTPGRYLVKFSAGCGTSGIAPQWWDDARSAAKASPVLVTVGATHSGIDATMKPAK